MKLFYFTLLLAGLALSGMAQPVTIGDRITFKSAILNDERSFQICLPASYFITPANKYPVIYMIDGDYYFHFLTGLVEQLSISEQMPEMIVVGVSGKGTPTYRKNCQPYDAQHPDAGNAETVQAYIEKELMPYINKHYHTNGYDVLAGHSVAGLFAINTLLNKPELFDAYIAISPSIWKVANLAAFTGKVMNHLPAVKTPVYITQGNETGMKIDTLVAFLKSRQPANIDWQFKHNEQETHASTALVSMEWALKDLFSTYKLDSGYFADTLNYQSIDGYVQQLKGKYRQTFNIPDYVMAYTVYDAYSKPGAIEKLAAKVGKYYPQSVEELNNQLAARYVADTLWAKAEEVYRTMLKQNPNSYKAWRGLATVATKTKHPVQARQYIDKAIALVRQQKARQWLINELVEERK